MTLLFKSLIGAGVVGGGAGLSLGGYYLFKSSDPKTLLEKFERDGIEILDLSSSVSDSSSGDGSLWGQKLTSYNSSDQAQNRFPNLPSTSGATIQQKQLIDECKKHFGASPEEIEKTAGLKDKVKKWCTKDKSQG